MGAEAAVVARQDFVEMPNTEICQARAEPSKGPIGSCARAAGGRSDQREDAQVLPRDPV
jgi:hypothetical protein